jgi:hypothetical protein
MACGLYSRSTFCTLAEGSIQQVILSQGRSGRPRVRRHEPVLWKLHIDSSKSMPQISDDTITENYNETWWRTTLAAPKEML